MKTLERTRSPMVEMYLLIWESAEKQAAKSLPVSVEIIEPDTADHSL